MRGAPGAGWCSSSSASGGACPTLRQFPKESHWHDVLVCLAPNAIAHQKIGASIIAVRREIMRAVPIVVRLQERCQRLLCRTRVSTMKRDCNVLDRVAKTAASRQKTIPNRRQGRVTDVAMTGFGADMEIHWMPPFMQNSNLAEWRYR